MAAGNTEAGKKLIFSFNAKPAENADRCLNCHNSSSDQRLFNRSEHKMMGVACNQCHSAHLVAAPRPALKTEFTQAKFFELPERSEENRWLRESLLKQKQPDLCFGCHKTIQAQFALPTHHRVPEGLMKCTDCHEAHGTMNRPLLKKANFEVCVSCHAEKRGPFLYEHAAVKVEGCTACHSPHGTIERNLLLRREGRFLCLQCHVDPSAANVPTAAWDSRHAVNACAAMCKSTGPMSISTSCNEAYHETTPIRLSAHRHRRRAGRSHPRLGRAGHPGIFYRRVPPGFHRGPPREV